MVEKECFKVIGKLYGIPYCKRWTALGDALTAKNTKFEILSVDGCGIYVYCAQEDYRSYFGSVSCYLFERIRNPLKTIDGGTYYIEANSVEEAISIFNTKLGTKIGGDLRKQKALWIDEHKPIIEYPVCKFLHRNSRNEYICGELDLDDKDGINGIYGFCILHGGEGMGCRIEKILKKHLKHPTKNLTELGEYKVILLSR